MEQTLTWKLSISLTHSHELIGRKVQGVTKTSRHEELLGPDSEAEI